MPLGLASTEGLDLTRCAGTKVFCELDSIEHAAVHAGLYGYFVVSVFVVETPRGDIVSSRFDPYALRACRFGRSFKPTEDFSTKALALTRLVHCKQHEMGIVVPVFHDSEGVKSDLLANHDYIGICGSDGSCNSFGAPCPRQTMLDQVARHRRDRLGVWLRRDAHVQGGCHVRSNVRAKRATTAGRQGPD